MNPLFEQFLSIYPPDVVPNPLDGVALRDAVKRQFGVSVPEIIVDFWKVVGAGYFGNRELYFFGDGSKPLPRDSLVEWNLKDFWGEIFSAPELRPIFFAETCFGYQLGWRYETGKQTIELFSPDTFKVFAISDSIEDLFARVLSTKFALARPASLVTELGLLPDGMHFAPILSPLVGGKQELKNMHTETANVHLRVSLATLKAVRNARNAPKN